MCFRLLQGYSNLDSVEIYDKQILQFGLLTDYKRLGEGLEDFIRKYSKYKVQL